MTHWASVLLVDDDPTTRRWVAAGLRGAGCSVRSAGNAVEALLEAVRGPYDMVLLDLDMPGLSGADILPYLRRFAQTTPIVAMSSGTGSEQERAMLRGAQCVLHKPIDLQIAVGLVRLARRRQLGQPAERLPRPSAALNPA